MEHVGRGFFKTEEQYQHYIKSQFAQAVPYQTTNRALRSEHAASQQMQAGVESNRIWGKKNDGQQR